MVAETGFGCATRQCGEACLAVSFVFLFVKRTGLFLRPVDRQILKTAGRSGKPARTAIRRSQMSAPWSCIRPATFSRFSIAPSFTAGSQPVNDAQGVFNVLPGFWLKPLDQAL